MSRVYHQKVYIAAMLCHEANRAYCQSIGDDSQPLWADAPDNIKDSALNGAAYVLNNPDSNPESQHNNWLQFKLDDGWSYGPVKDMTNKRHPCMVPYHQLPLEQRMKDTVFRSVALAAFRCYDEGKLR